MATPITPGATPAGGFWRRRNIIIAVIIVMSIIISSILFSRCGKKAEEVVKEEPGKEKKPAVTVTMEPADGSTVSEINTLKFQFSEAVKTDKVEAKVKDPKGQNIEGSRSGFDQKLLTWVLLKRSIEPGKYEITVESSEKEFEPANFTLTVGEPPADVPWQKEKEEADELQKKLEEIK